MPTMLGARGGVRSSRVRVASLRRSTRAGATVRAAGVELAERVREAGASGARPPAAAAPDEAESTAAAARAKALEAQIAAMGGAELTDPAAFEDTLEHWAWCAALFGACGGLAVQAAAGVAAAGGEGAWEVAVAVALAYWLSDLGTGVFHWSVDNYGSKATPVVGGVIDSFQGHHKWPWTITKRGFANNVHKVCKAPALVAVPLLFVPLSPSADAFWAVFGACVVLSQQFHAWAHSKPSELPGAVLALQDAGLLVSRKEHGAHHKSPFEGNYCIVSGWWNRYLDESGFFRGLERVVYRATGVAPRCWTEADFEVQEEAPEGWDQRAA